MHADGRSRFLVLHDYGMGGLWWWINAPSAETILETVAEVEVITDQEQIDKVLAGGDVDEVDLDAVTDEGLSELIEQRADERKDPDYGKLVGRGTVYLRQSEDVETYLLEIGADGYRTRQIVVQESGDAMRIEDWPFNPMFDLRSPELARMEIPAADFEDVWGRARPEPSDEGTGLKRTTG